MRAEAPYILNGVVCTERTTWLSGEVVTFLNKYAFPATWVAMISMAVFVTNGHVVVAPEFRFVAVAIVLGSAFMLWFSLRLQRVGYAGRELVVSNYWRQERIPFTQVAAVESVWWYRRRLVRIRLRSESPFGLVIYYLPKWGFVRYLWSSPEKELRDLIS
jgi:hypothetical protein